LTPFGHSLPSLKGKSYQGSKPTTALSATLSLMPHCCPQKQQWVSTTLVDVDVGVPSAWWVPVEVGP
jgi:hypothetical protein